MRHTIFQKKKPSTQNCSKLITAANTLLHSRFQFFFLQRFWAHTAPILSASAIAGPKDRLMHFSGFEVVLRCFYFLCCDACYLMKLQLESLRLNPGQARPNRQSWTLCVHKYTLLCDKRRESDRPGPHCCCRVARCRPDPRGEILPATNCTLRCADVAPNFGE